MLAPLERRGREGEEEAERPRRDFLAESLEPILSPFGAHGPVTFRAAPVQKGGVKNSLFRPHAPRSSPGRRARKFFL